MEMLKKPFSICGKMVLRGAHDEKFNKDDNGMTTVNGLWDPSFQMK